MVPYWTIAVWKHFRITWKWKGDSSEQSSWWNAFSCLFRDGLMRSNRVKAKMNYKGIGGHPFMELSQNEPFSRKRWEIRRMQWRPKGPLADGAHPPPVDSVQQRTCWIQRCSPFRCNYACGMEARTRAWARGHAFKGAFSGTGRGVVALGTHDCALMILALSLQVS